MSDTRKPDEVITPGDDRAWIRRLAVDGMMTFPHLVKLFVRLMGDGRVSRRAKLVVLGALVYVVSPIDVIPEVIPVAGFADDMLVAALAVNHLVSSAGEEIVLEHWDGSRDLLELVRSVLAIAGDLVPTRVRRLFRALSGS